MMGHRHIVLHALGASVPECCSRTSRLMIGELCRHTPVAGAVLP